jgi:hypothetical protein
MGFDRVLLAFHIDTARVRPVGGGYRNNELFQVLKDYRMLIHEDVPYGATNRLVRILAQKSAPLPADCSWEQKNYQQGDFMCWSVTRWTCGAEGWQSAGKCPTASRP